MSEIIFSIAMLLLSIAATYFFCIRPMQRGRCAVGQIAQERRQSREHEAQEDAGGRLSESTGAGK